MNDDELTTRLEEAGAMGVALDATVRPDPLAQTALAAEAEPADARSSARPIAVPDEVRMLPRITIDLRRAEEIPGAAEGGEADLEVVQVLGQGGMGKVYVAHQHSLARQVALKVPHRGASEAEARALVQEGVIAGQLEHPGIVPVHALGLDVEGRPALVMKLIDGVAWDQLLDDPAHDGWDGWPGSLGDRLSGHLEILARVCDAICPQPRGGPPRSQAPEHPHRSLRRRVRSRLGGRHPQGGRESGRALRDPRLHGAGDGAGSGRG